LGNEEECIADQAKSEKEGDELSHASDFSEGDAIACVSLPGMQRQARSELRCLAKRSDCR
jgi:hypothetical protein